MRTLFATLWAAALLATPALAQSELITKDWNAATQPSVGAYPDAFEARTFTRPNGDVVPYRLLIPPPSATPPPLIIVLHGSGMAMGTDNHAHLGPFITAWGNPAISQAYPAYVAAPQVATRSVNYAPSADGLLATIPGPSFEDLMALVDELAHTLPIDRRRIYVMGFSMGGSATLEALVARPDLFAAGVAFAPIGPDRALAARVSAIPVMLVHGDLDPENHIEPDIAWFHALTAAGGHPRMVVYRGMDHRVPTDMIAGGAWRAWLFAQMKPAP